MLLVKQYAADMKQEFGELLRERRNERGLSQRALAEKLGGLGFSIDATAITRMESGQREPKLSEALTICDYLNIDITILDYGVHGLAYHGAVDQATHSFLEARKALRQFINNAEYVYMVYRPQSDDRPMTHEELLQYILDALENGRTQETDSLPDANQAHIDADFRKLLIAAAIANIEGRGHGSEA